MSRENMAFQGFFAFFIEARLTLSSEILADHDFAEKDFRKQQDLSG